MTTTNTKYLGYVLVVRYQTSDEWHTACIYYDYSERFVFDITYTGLRDKVNIMGLYDSPDDAERALREDISDDINIYVTKEDSTRKEYIIPS